MSQWLGIVHNCCSCFWFLSLFVCQAVVLEVLEHVVRKPNNVNLQCVMLGLHTVHQAQLYRMCVSNDVLQEQPVFLISTVWLLMGYVFVSLSRLAGDRHSLKWEGVGGSFDSGFDWISI